jgi:hypothetical protein
MAACFYKDSKCCIAKNVVYIPIFMAVSIKDSSAIAICFSKQRVHLIFIAVSIRAASAI